MNNAKRKPIVYRRFPMDWESDRPWAVCVRWGNNLDEYYTFETWRGALDFANGFVSA
jgi:hypothetical protein